MGIKGALGAPGMNTTLKMINEGPAQDMANTNMMAGMLSQMIVLMPLLICSIIAGALSVVSLKVRAGEHAAERAKRYAGSLALNAVASLVLSLMLYVVVRYVAGLEADMMPFVSYCWITALFLMTFFGGIGCIRGRLAAAVGVTILLLGITSAYLPFEALPAFWQDWITPWAPEFFMGNGLREVVFAGGSIWNQGTVATGIYACIGLFFGVLSVAVGNKASARRSA